MILTGNEIAKQHNLGKIIIDPFNIKNVNPNSYNYHLDDKYIIADKNQSIIHSIPYFEYKIIPIDGLLLIPGNLYLCNTYEIIGSEYFVTSLIGRSSLGRLGVFLELSADLGNLGPAHKWTLEITCIQPIVIYPYMPVGQISFWVPTGEVELYCGKYTNFNIAHPSLDKKLINDLL